MKLNPLPVEPGVADGEFYRPGPASRGLLGKAAPKLKAWVSRGGLMLRRPTRDFNYGGSNGQPEPAAGGARQRDDHPDRKDDAEHREAAGGPSAAGAGSGTRGGGWVEPGAPEGPPASGEAGSPGAEEPGGQSGRGAGEEGAGPQ